MSAQLSSAATPLGIGKYALSLSGGGYRAMLFHAGAICRLHEGGLLRELQIVSSVSGGSIAAGALAIAWPKLDLEKTGDAAQKELKERLLTPLINLAETTIDLKAILRGLSPGRNAAGVVAKWYGRYLFGEAQLAELPSEPTFVFNATSLQTGEIWEFSRACVGGRITGWAPPRKLRLRDAVAASSAYPPLLGPAKLDLVANAIQPQDWTEHLETEHCPHGIDEAHVARHFLSPSDLNGIRQKVLLVDGGVRDNLGLVAVGEENRRRIKYGQPPLHQLVSDGRATYLPNKRPWINWLGQGRRVIDIALSEPDQLRLDFLVRGQLREMRKNGLAFRNHENLIWMLLIGAYNDCQKNIENM